LQAAVGPAHVQRLLKLFWYFHWMRPEVVGGHPTLTTIGRRGWQNFPLPYPLTLIALFEKEDNGFEELWSSTKNWDFNGFENKIHQCVLQVA
jgi:hypothetical protein